MKKNIILLTLTAALLINIPGTGWIPVTDAETCLGVECECKGPNCPPDIYIPPDTGKTLEELSMEAWSAGYTLMKQGRLDAAAELFEKAIKYDPDNSSPYISLGDIYVKWEWYRKAESMYQEAIDLGDTNAWPNLNALRDKINKQKAVAANNQAVEYEKAGDYQRAIEFYEKALRIKPDYWLAKDNLSKLRARLNRSESKMFEDQGVALENLGFLDSAKGYYKKALEIDPGNTTAAKLLQNLEIRMLRGKAKEYAVQGNADRAREYYRKILELDPGNSYARDMIDHMDEWIATYKGREFEDKGDQEKAAEYYLKALEHNPDHKEARTAIKRIAKNLHDRAVGYHESGDDATAREFFKKVLAIDPANEYAQGNLRKLDINESNRAGAEAMDKGEYEKAIRHFQKALALDPENEYALETLHNVTIEQGTSSVHRGSFSSGAEYYRKALSVNPEDKEVREQLRMTEKVIGWKKAITGRDGGVPLPALPAEEEIEKSFINISTPEWPRMKAALSFAGEIKERAKTEAGHFLKVQAMEQLYSSTIGKYKIVRITGELGKTYRQMRDTQLNLRLRLLNRVVGTMENIMIVGSSVQNNVDSEKNWAGTLETVEETREVTRKELKGKVEEAAPAAWKSMMDIFNSARDGSEAVVLYFKRSQRRSE